MNTGLIKKSRHMVVTVIAVSVILWLQAFAVFAAPSGSDLLHACNQSLESGFESIEGSMCAWYITACDCVSDKNIPAVCLPEDAELDELAKLVIDGLSTRDELLNEYAAFSAAVILSEKFPCPE